MLLGFLASGPGRLFIVGFCVAALSVGLYIQVRANGRLRADRDHMLDINKENEAAMDVQNAAIRRANEIAANETADAEVLRRRYNAIRMDIANAQPGDDGPLAPVLRNALDRLPESDSHKTPSSSATSSSRKPYTMPERP